MNLNNKTEPTLDLKISNWELDFYSRPIIESNGKKRWELIICSTKSYKTEDVFHWNKKCPANEVNSVWLTKAINEAISDAKKEGWAKPSIVRFWRSSMKSIIKKSLEATSIDALVSRRTYDLFDRIEFLEKEIYPKEKGYVRGVLAPTFTSKIENSPKPLPEAVRGDALTISEISIGELKSAENWPMEFGDIFPIQQDLDDKNLIPGLRLFSKDRSLALSAWFSCLEPIKLTIRESQLILEASEDDKWLVTDLPEKDAKILSTKFLANKKNSYGYQFISIQSTPYIEKFAGFWILRDIELIS
ncbi:Tab2/Atab2 family RNA-binding protein [Prochlorococcus sp. AH-736-N17]|nr:Tab2 family RNA-binding protein [Prochlorococcus sp. AH-736-N17]MDA9728954.1 Tab2/Atab2 family RNA-binding protein [Prochlorococcus sp. AH-736-N17]